MSGIVLWIRVVFVGTVLVVVVILVVILFGVVFVIMDFVEGIVGLESEKEADPSRGFV
jgi:hypothetical protein